MLDDAIRKYLDGPSFSYVATRDADNKPFGHRPFGHRVDADGTIRVFFADKLHRRIQDNLELNGQISFASGHPTTFEAYQFKGTFVRIEALDEADKQAHASWRDQTLEISLSAGFPDSLKMFFAIDPTIVVVFEVTEVFVQTPGPGAGDALKGAS